MMKVTRVPGENNRPLGTPYFLREIRGISQVKSIAQVVTIKS